MSASVLGASQVDAALQRGARLIDVLPRASYDQAHLPRAVSLPLAEVERAIERGDGRLPRDLGAEIVVYCGGPT